MLQKKLKLRVEPISTQIIPRDRHAQFFATLGIIASSIERFSLEIRHLQRTEVSEVEEFLEKNKRVHQQCLTKKSNFSENLTGLARLIRSSVIPVLKMSLYGTKEIFLILL